METLIVGIGNRWMASDALGCLVYDWLAQRSLPPHVTLVDGGLQGLNLLALLEGRKLVIFADALAVDGYSVAGVGHFSGPEVAATAHHFGHSSGLPYLLAMLPHVMASPPMCRVVGAAGFPSPALVEAVALACLEEVASYAHA